MKEEHQKKLTCDAEIRETSCRPVRSDEEMLAGAPRCNLMLTLRSLSTREIALGDVFPGKKGVIAIIYNTELLQLYKENKDERRKKRGGKEKGRKSYKVRRYDTLRLMFYGPWKSGFVGFVL